MWADNIFEIFKWAMSWKRLGSPGLWTPPGIKINYSHKLENKLQLYKNKISDTLDKREHDLPILE